MARPKKEIDKKAFENLCGIQCTKEEICDFFEVSEKTLNSWCKREYDESFSLVFQQKRGKGKISLRRTQWKLAEKSTSMAIWLGKQYLGQHDNPNTALDDEEQQAKIDQMRANTEHIKQADGKSVDEDDGVILIHRGGEEYGETEDNS